MQSAAVFENWANRFFESEKHKLHLFCIVIQF